MGFQMNLSKHDYERMTRLIFHLSTSFKRGSNELQHLLSEYFGYHSSIFWKVDQEGNLSNPINHRISDHLVEDYLDCFHDYDYLHPKNQLHLYQKEAVLRLEDVTPLKSYERSDYYKEFMKKHQNYHEMVITFHSRNKLNGVLGIAKPKSVEGFSEEDRNRFRTLAPIVSNLLYLESEYEEQRKEKEILEAFAAKNNTGFILLDQNYNVIYMNEAAWRVYKETAIHKNIESFIQDIVVVLTKRYTSSSVLQLRGYNMKVIAHQELFLSKESRYAVIIEEDKTVVPFNNDPYLHNLTKREKEVCYYLKMGYTYKEISEKLYISIHTVNKHIKNIYQKIGVNSRASLQTKLLHFNSGDH